MTKGAIDSAIINSNGFIAELPKAETNTKMQAKIHIDSHPVAAMTLATGYPVLRVNVGLPD
ncbi:hypothetical protein FORC36_4240 [Vibrio vulnificus]|nr:hypothetical protein FORC36_4240 [Vibrio vulnificus]